MGTGTSKTSEDAAQGGMCRPPRCNEAKPTDADAQGQRQNAFATMCPFASGKSINTGEIDTEMFKNAKRILITTDMSTECDDECALLWILSALNRRKIITTIELMMSDSQVRYQWMAYIFNEKLREGGEWKVSGGGSSIQVGIVLINLYLAHDPDRESSVIASIQSKAPGVKLDIEEVTEGDKTRKTAIRRAGSLGGNIIGDVPGGHLNSIVIAGPIQAMPTEFFDRFTTDYTYVVGTPGGINCPMPSWSKLLAKFHQIGKVLYLTPQFTRGVRFPRAYVLKNPRWNDFVKRTIFDSTLMCMAKRPEIPAKFGNWGLMLRLNVANAAFCRDWYTDATGSSIESIQRPQQVVDIVNAYVQRNSGDDRLPGAIAAELHILGVDTSGLKFDGAGQPASPDDKAKVCNIYREQLFEHTFICVLTTYTLIWQNEQNFAQRKGSQGFKSLEQLCGYEAPYTSLAAVYGNDSALEIVKSLPLKTLTPAYDVVAMICAVSSLESGGLEELGLEIETADASMASSLITEEEYKASDHAILMVSNQNEKAINGQVSELTTS